MGLANLPSITQYKSMIKYTSIDNLRLVGGHPALDFANTVVARRDRYGPDLLKDYSDVLDWAVRADLLDRNSAEGLRKASKADESRSRAAFRGSKSLREAIHAVFAAHAAGQEVPAKATKQLDRAAKRARASSSLTCSDGKFSWRVSDDLDLNTVSHLVAEASIDLLTQQDKMSRVRECRGHNCGWLFLDTSRGGRRKWCSEEDCGTYARVRKYRSKNRGCGTARK